MNPKTKAFRFKDELKNIGRMQFFYHSPSSDLPIRDVLGELGHGKKTEPHIEIGAENFLEQCYQKQIVSFIDSDEKYLFLVTNCQSEKYTEVQGKQSVVGFIEKHFFGTNKIHGKEHQYIQGFTKIVGFEDAIILQELGYSNRVRNLLIDENRTSIIMEKFISAEDITDKCIDEIIRLDPKNKTCYHTRKLFRCEYAHDCARV